jgi:hypothetical protein
MTKRTARHHTTFCGSNSIAMFADLAPDNEIIITMIAIAQ